MQVTDSTVSQTMQVTATSSSMDAPLNKGVLLVGNFLSQSRGIRCACEEIAIRLKNSGWTVVTTSDKEARIIRFADMLSTTLLSQRKYHVAHIDVFSGASFLWAEAVAYVLKRLNKPFVITLRGGNLPAFAAKNTSRVATLLHSADAVTAPSAFLKNAFSSYGVNVTVLRNGIDLNRYSYRLRELPAPRLVWLRAFHHIYNPTLVPRVLDRLRRRHTDVRIAMIGPDKGDGSRQQTELLARKLDVLDRIEFVGPVPKDAVPGHLGRGDIFLNTTNIDNAPVSLSEALACGLCSVSTNVDGIPDLVDGGRECLLVPPDDEHAMASAVDRILTNPRLAATLSRSGHEKAQEFAWPNVLRQWDALLYEVARRN